MERWKPVDHPSVSCIRTAKGGGSTDIEHAGRAIPRIPLGVPSAS
jgi:hypothetical protein